MDEPVTQSSGRGAPQHAEDPRPATRRIMHVDMDAFYAAVEIRHRPELRDVPVVIGADPRGGAGRGVAVTANYAARRYGIHSAMPISQAWRACPHAVFIRPSFAKYKTASRSVMAVLEEYADVLEVVGMDEAYLDVSDACPDWGRVPAFAHSLQAAVKRATGLSCSVGAAPTKSIAKIASDHRKPHGVTVVAPDEVEAFLAPLPVRLIPGCGPKTTARLHDEGHHTIGDLVDAGQDILEARLGKHGAWLWRVATADDGRSVHAERGPGKSHGNERTFPRDETDTSKVRQTAARLLAGLLARQERAFATLTVKVRYSDFSTLTRARTLSIPVEPDNQDAAAVAQATMESLLDPLLDGRAVRLVGVRLSGFTPTTGQQSLSRFGIPAPTAAAATT